MSPSSTTPTFGQKTTDVRRWEDNPRPWILLILEEGIIEHTQEDAQQRKIMPVLIRETASHLRNVTPWTHSLKALPAQRLLPASRLQLVRHCRRWSEPERCEVWHVASNWRAACRQHSGRGDEKGVLRFKRGKFLVRRLLGDTSFMHIKTDDTERGTLGRPDLGSHLDGSE